MSVPLTINGVTYDFPTVDDTDWGYAVTAWAEAITANIFPKTGGNFFLAADLNFGPAAAIIANGFSAFVTPSTTGFLRLGYTDTIAWRNQANNDDYTLAVQDFGSAASSVLTFNGKQMVDTSTAQVLYNKTLVDPVLSGSITINITPNRAAVSDDSGNVVASNVTRTQVGYLSNLTDDIQNQLNGKQPSSTNLTILSTLNGDGITVKTGSFAWATRTLVSPDGTITITNPTGSAGNPGFVVNSVPFSRLTGIPGTLAGYGITDGVQNTGNTPSISSGITSARPIAGSAGRLFIDSTSKSLQRDNGTSWDVIGSAYVSGSPSTPYVNPVATGDGSLAIGDNVTTLGLNSTAVGRNAQTTLNGTRGVAVGYAASVNFRDAVAIGGYGVTPEFAGEVAFGNASDRNGTPIGRMSMVTMVQKTTSATVTELDLDQATHDRMTTTDNYTYLYDCDIVARDTTNLAAKNYASWNIKFTFIRGVGVASVILSGVQKSIVGASGATGWDVTVTADTTGGRPAIKVKGATSTNVSWSAFVKICRVSNL